MIKTHFAVDAVTDASVCKRGNRHSSRLSSNPFHTDCGLCKRHPAYVKAAAEAIAKREEEFQAQEPRTFGEPWRDGLITCKCGSVSFRYRGRSCHGHYDDYVCAICHESTSRLTETGMCF